MDVKICGITRNEDLKTCEKYDLRFIGFINIKRSKRFLDIETVKRLVKKMENPENAVLILEPQNASEVIKKAGKSGIKNVQIHSLSADEIAEIKGINIIRAIGIPERISKSKVEEIEEFAEICEYILFDSVVSGKSGGTGKQISLETAIKAAEIAKIRNPDIKLVLAGGMNKERITKEGKMIKKIFNYIDVNSGVEDSPGIKNELKISEFMKTYGMI
ncbi:MAG: phosphoribosylanthranilate isomerase [Methanobacterium sp.]